MRISGLDREALVRRNQRLATEKRRPSRRAKLRDRMLSSIARLPIPQQHPRRQRLLIIRPDHLGDAVLTTPAIQLIKRAKPDLELHALCGGWSADLFSRFPEIDRVLTLDFPGFRRRIGSSRLHALRLAIDASLMLRRIGYSSAIIMRHDHWWGGLLAYLAGVPERIGCDVSGVAPFLTFPVPHQHQHAIWQNLRLAEAWLGSKAPAAIKLDFPLEQPDIDDMARRLAGITMPIICLHPGAGAASKLWLADKWAALADELARDDAAQIVFSGASAEQAMIDGIVARMQHQALILAGETSVGQLAALYARARIVIGMDSGAMHVAAALGRPTVTLFGPADPIEFAPWGDRERNRVVASAIGCRPCRILDWSGDDAAWHPCVREISVRQALAAARQALRSAE